MSSPSDKMRPSDPGSENPSVLQPAGEEEAVWEATVRKDILVGQRIGEYLVRRRIGSGGMGVVYEGEHPVIGRKVAIKIIRPDSVGGGQSRDLVSEARATSSIRHRGIIDIFGFGTLPGIGQYLVMEYLTGQPLDEVLLNRAPLPLPEALRLTGEILGALSAAHGVGVIHRDLKPGNIFVVRESNGTEYVKVLDFGLAKQAAAPHGTTPQTRASVVLGTPEYMAPEQACGQAVSPRTDLYAVGIILFEMVTGRLPFKGDSAMHIAIQQVHSQPPAPSSFVQGLPPELEALILSLLAKAPEQRPPSAEAVVQELDAIARTLQPEAPGSRPGARRSSGSGLRRQASPPSEAGTSPTVISGSLAAQSAAASTLRLEPAPSARSVLPWRAGLAVALPLLIGVGVVLGLHRPEAPVPAPVVTQAAVAQPPAPAPAAPAPEPAPTVAQTLPAPAAPVTVAQPTSEPAPTPVAPMAPGTLEMSVKCFYNLYVDGALRGQAHTRSLPLSPGPHTVELKDNPELKDYSLKLVIRPGVKSVLRAPCPNSK